MPQNCTLSNNLSEWVGDRATMNTISKLCLTKNIEYAGTLKYGRRKRKDSKDGMEVTGHSTKSGDASSVDTPTDIISWHTHPKSCYVEENTIWGWPSGEDMRECIRMGMNGTVAHLIFAIEGVYIIQTNPSFTNYLRQMSSSQDRGHIIGMIELYFKATHGFRERDIAASTNCWPSDFCMLANKFTLDKLCSNSRRRGQEGLTNFGTYENGKYMNNTSASFLKTYATDEDFAMVDATGNHFSQNMVPSQRKLRRITRSAQTGTKKQKKFKLRKCCSNPRDEKWKNGQIFQVCLYYNKHVYPRPQDKGDHRTNFNIIKGVSRVEQENVPKLHWYTISNCNVKDLSKKIYNY